MNDATKKLAKLLHLAQQGDEEALQHLCKELEQIMRPYFWQKFRDSAIVDDLTQETYIRLLRNLPTIREPMKLKSFVLSVALHVSQDYLRQKYRKREAGITDNEINGEDYETTLTRLSNTGLTADPIFEKMDFDSALMTLPEKTRKILLLKAEGYKYEEIADVMNLSVSGVKMQIKRSIEKLKIQLFPVTFFFLFSTI